MSLDLIWQIPTRGDGPAAMAVYGDASVRRRGERARGERSPFTDGVTDPRGSRFNFYDHLHQIAAAAELSVFDGVQIQRDPLGEEPWIVAGYLARGTRRLRLLAEFEASWGSSVYAAKNAAASSATRAAASTGRSARAAARTNAAAGATAPRTTTSRPASTSS